MNQMVEVAVPVDNWHTIQGLEKEAPQRGCAEAFRSRSELHNSDTHWVLSYLFHLSFSTHQLQTKHQTGKKLSTLTVEVVVVAAASAEVLSLLLVTFAEAKPAFLMSPLECQRVGAL